MSTPTWILFGFAAVAASCLALTGCGDKSGDGKSGSGAAGSGGSTVTAGGSGGAGTNGAGAGSEAGGGGGGTHEPDPCVDSGKCPVGVWTDVTPSGVNLVDPLSCGNYGTESVLVDPKTPSTLYTYFNCQGLWKSTDYGLSWKGPINTGTNGAKVGDGAGGIMIPSSAKTDPPVIYLSNIRGTGIGFWRSTDGGVNWTQSQIPGSNYQDVYPAEADPYDPDHLVMAGHEQDLLLESTDGGKTWKSIAYAAGMKSPSGGLASTGAVFFIDTGDPATTAKTWLWLADSANSQGTWRTDNAGDNWMHVDDNEHPHSNVQIHQPNPAAGVIYMAGINSSLGDGVLRSADWGKTWAHAGLTTPETAPFGTSKHTYALYGWAIGAGQALSVDFEIGPADGTGTWTATDVPSAMKQGPGHVAVTSDGHHDIAVAACFNGGLWRYIEL
jgi:hypothetical protein